MLIQYGQKNQLVQDLQAALNQNGAQLTVDGDFGEATLAAVKEYQRANNLIVDGVVGDRTWGLLTANYSDSKHLTESDISAAAQSLGVEVAAIKAIIRTEAPNGGFNDNGQVTVLFERHKMYHYLSKKQGKAAADTYARDYPNLVNTVAGGYYGGTAENARLANAMRIDAECALLSASYGRFQVMGFNYKGCGYDSVQAFYDAMAESEGKQLQAFVALINSNAPLKKALKAKNWEQVAELYNGKAYRKNQYHLKLARYYALYQSDNAPVAA